MFSRLNGRDSFKWMRDSNLNSRYEKENISCYFWRTSNITCMYKKLSISTKDRVASLMSQRLSEHLSFFNINLHYFLYFLLFCSSIFLPLIPFWVLITFICLFITLHSIVHFTYLLNESMIRVQLIMLLYSELSHERIVRMKIESYFLGITEL